MIASVLLFMSGPLGDTYRCTQGARGINCVSEQHPCDGVKDNEYYHGHPMPVTVIHANGKRSAFTVCSIEAGPPTPTAAPTSPPFVVRLDHIVENCDPKMLKVMGDAKPLDIIITDAHGKPLTQREICKLMQEHQPK